MKRIIALVLSMVITATLSVPVMAAGGDYNFFLYANGKEITEVEVGEIVNVTLEITEANDAPTMELFSMQDYVCFDPDFLEIIESTITAYSKDGVELSANPVEIMDKIDEVIVSRQSLVGATVDLPLVAVTIQFKALCDGTTKVSHADYTEEPLYLLMDENGDQHNIALQDAIIKIGTGIPEDLADLKFETNGGAKIPEVTVNKGQTVDLSSYIPTRDKYVFMGWYADKKFKNPVKEVMLNADTTVYAKWAEARTLSFETYGGTTFSPATFGKDTTVDLTGYRPTKSGYTFIGWYKESGLINNVLKVTVSNNVTVYAKWKKNENTGDNPGSGGGGGGGGGGATVERTVTFKNADGTEIAKVTMDVGKKIELSSYTYKKDGYKFVGWYLDKELTTPATDFELKNNITLYAKWKEVAPGTVMGQYHPEILTTDHYAYIMGRDGGMICPEDNITRAEVATIFFRLLTEEVRTANITKENVFDDVNASDWHNTAVSTLAKLEIIKGRTENGFEPDAFITRAEFATIAARFSNAPYTEKELFTDVNGHWAEEYINKAAAYGWIVGDGGKFRPDDNITRAEVMTIVNRVLGRLPESEADLLPEMTKWKDNSDTSAWYYLAVQEATNSHDCMQKEDGVHEEWIKLNENPDWTKFE